MYRNKGLMIRKLVVIVLAFVVAVTFTPLLGDGSYAATSKSGKKYDEKVKYVTKDANGNEKELDPEIFTGDGKVINADELDNLDIKLEPDPVGKEPKAAPKDKTSLEDESFKGERLSEKEGQELNKKLGIKTESSDIDAEKLETEEPSAEITQSDEDKGLTEADTDSDETAELQTEEDVQVEGQILDVQEQADASVEVSGTTYVTPTVYFTPNKGSGTVNVKGSITTQDTTLKKYRFGNVVVDSKVVATIMKKDLNLNINMRNFSYGVHTIYVEVYYQDNNGKLHFVEWVYKTNVPFYMYSTPTSGGSFAVYSTYMDYMPTNFLSGGLAIRMQYSADGVNWVDTGYMPNYYQTYTIGGLAPSTTYQTRIYFYQTRPINGHYYNGAETGSFLYTGAYTTGIASLPKIKSVKVKATKVKKRKAGVYGWYTGYYFGSVKYYTYKIKVTVQFKKKPGLNGLYINGAWKPGNKKKYTLTLGPYANYSKPRGKRFNVYLYSAVAPGGYGGYSPMVAQNKKVK